MSAAHGKTLRKTGGRQRHRTRVAISTLLVFIGGLLFLGFQSGGAGVAATTSPTEYLLFSRGTSAEDPLSLVGRVSGLELTGVSADGTVIGYSSQKTLTEVGALLDAALQSDGWVAVAGDSAGLISYSRQDSESQPWTTLIVQCFSVGEGSSFVLERW